MFTKMKDMTYGTNVISEIDGIHSNMLMDVSIHKFKSGEKLVILDNEKEIAVLVLDGKLKISWNNESVDVERHSIFDEEPSCLHVSKGVSIEIESVENGEILIQKTENNQDFIAKFYGAADCKSDVFGEGVLGDTSRRVVRTIFDYFNAPYSNMVMGEVITYPGKWSSYPPHHHPQPEIYYYRFDKPQGFGCAIIGEDAFKITDHSMAAIPGGLVHPQATAPGYAMYYCWMIRHLDNNPWTARIDEEAHNWLLDKAAKIWPDK